MSKIIEGRRLQILLLGASALAASGFISAQEPNPTTTQPHNRPRPAAGSGSPHDPGRHAR